MGQLTFHLSRAEFDALANGDAIIVQDAPAPSRLEWSFGPPDKSRLDR